MNSVIVPELPVAKDARASQPEPIGTPFGLSSDSVVFLEQVDRILRSNELSGADVLRRLLRFLADKTISGEADDLKEYTVAIDGLGKPASYDPRHTSAVRIQASRLRQKLIDYYRGEGVEDAVVVGLPKGHFRLTCKYRGASAHPLTEVAEHHLAIAALAEAEDAIVHERASARQRFSPVVWVAVISIALNIFLGVEHLITTRTAKAAVATELSQDLKDLWSPFIVSERPLNLVLEDPLFVEFKYGQGIYYRDKSVGSWSDVAGSAPIAKLRHLLNNASIQPSKYYTAFGEADASFLIGRLFGTRNQNFFSLVKASEVSSTQLANNNILSVGIPRTMFARQLQEMPVAAEFNFVPEGIQNLHPREGEPAVYTDEFVTAPSEEGYVYALVSHFPGPQRNTDVENFVSNRAAGYVAAVQAFTDPGFARQVVSKLKAASGGKMPRYYQVVLKVTFRDSIPTETTSVLVRELH